MISKQITDDRPEIWYLDDMDLRVYPASDPKKAGQCLKQIRKDKGLSQSDLAQQAGISESMVAKI